MKRYSSTFERDYQFYLDNMAKFRIAGCTILDIPYAEDGATAKEAFHKFDSQGKLIPCKEPTLFKQILTCKKAINMHFRMWAEGFEDCGIPVDELMAEFTNPPDWVSISLQNQIDKYFPTE